MNSLLRKEAFDVLSTKAIIFVAAELSWAWGGANTSLLQLW